MMVTATVLMEVTRKEIIVRPDARDTSSDATMASEYFLGGLLESDNHGPVEKHNRGDIFMYLIH